jgi:hypothetical protein
MGSRRGSLGHRSIKNIDKKEGKEGRSSEEDREPG